MHQMCTHTPLAAEEFPRDEVDTVGRRCRLDLRLAVLTRVSSNRGDCVPGVPVRVCVCACVCVCAYACMYVQARACICVCLFVFVCMVQALMQERGLSQEKRRGSKKKLTQGGSRSPGRGTRHRRSSFGGLPKRETLSRQGQETSVKIGLAVSMCVFVCVCVCV
jgi:hypothetical protein